MGYETGTYMSYTTKSNTDGTVYYSYESLTSGCTASGNLAGVATSCLQVFETNADGTPAASPINQVAYVASSNSWYSTAKSTGSAAWSPLYTSTLMTTTQNVLSFASSIYDQTTKAFVGEVATTYFASSDSKFIHLEV